MPAYTFTAESFPCPWGFAWFDEPVVLGEGDDDSQPVRGLHWQIRPADPDGKVPVGLNGFVVAAPFPGLPFALRTVLYMGDRLDKALSAEHDGLSVMTHTIGSRPPWEEKYDALLRVFAGCLSFLEQRITTSVPRPATRGLRRQRGRERHPVFREVPDVCVIELRRRDYQARADGKSPDGSDAPAWQFQWIVSATGVGSTTLR